MSRTESARTLCHRWLISAALMLATLLLAVGLPRTAHAAPADGPGGPILVITATPAGFGNFYAEILRAEGLNQFAMADPSAIVASTLAAYDVVVLAPLALTDTQATTLANWVNAGGNLIAMTPDTRLHGLLGITAAGGSPLPNAYLRVETGAAPGAGIVAETLQYHGSAERYSLNGAAAVATLYSNASTATSHPAISLRSSGAGKAAAYAFDLATSIVYTRQGNPAWATQERDGFTPIRSNDKFFGNASGDPQADWIDLNKVAIPQADEQQRLFANLILHMNAAKKPLPRFWYFPKGKKAVIVMTGDDHGNNGTAGRFEQFKSRSPAGCSVADWECVRGTSYVYPSTLFASTPLTNTQAVGYSAEGFEIGLHLSTSCADYTPASLQSNYADQLAEFAANYPGLPAPRTQRHHCIVWSDWTTGASVQLANGMRLDTSYYYWPPSWVNNVPGLFTGSAMPMRFSGLDGSLIDVYLAATQMTDESGQTFPFTVNALLDRALGAEGYYGAYVVNAHTDIAQIVESDAVVNAALARGVPIVSSAQLLAWLDGRNASSFAAITWNGSALGFTVNRGANTNGLQGMLPVRSSSGVLGTLSRGGAAVPFTVEAIKGIDYAFFAADAGTYTATYAADGGAPTVTASTPAAGATGVATNTNITATFSEAMSPASISAASFELRSPANALIPATVSYDPATRVATLDPTAALAGSTAYSVTVRGGASDPRVKDLAGNALAASLAWSFTTGAGGGGGGCPCSAWSPSTVPGNPSVADPGPLELGVKFRADVNGSITGVRFYKGATNTGTHVGSLWTSGGQLLAQATFTGESASGWQQVNFSAPVAITANTVYVASYFAPNGNYAGDNGFFAGGGVDNGLIHLLQDGVSGGNGVYAYAAASTFPSSSFQATNYWVDVVFTTSGTSDTTAPTVATTGPAAGATGVAVGTTLSASFSEPLDAGSVGSATFELRNAANNTLVPAAVSYNPGTGVATLAPSATLAASTTYTATLRGGTEPRLKDLAGNALAANFNWSFTTGLAGGVCAAPPNAIVAENCLAGSPAAEWDVSGTGDASIQGFATQISVNRGQSVSFKVQTNAAAYRFDIYRMGYYGGLGARKVATVNPSASLPQSQPACLNDAATGLIDCGNWAVSGSWSVPAGATSGIYFAKLVRTDTGGASHIVFVVRDDAGTADLLFQTSDTTWQAYNSYGGNSLYTGSPVGRAYKVSYNRPFNTRAVDGGQDWVFNAEYPAVRWLEANGYGVSYTSGVDTDRAGSLLLNHKTFLSVGHDEYWSAAQRTNVEAARNAGVNLAFLSGNEIFWKTRWENSIDGSATPYRTLVSYKETQANAKIDPQPTWTGTWRDNRFSPPSDGGRPENALTGTIFTVNTGTTAISVPEAEGKLRLWRNTSIATLAPGTSATLPNGTLGYEWDSDLDNGFRPPGLIRLSNTTANNVQVLQDLGSTYGNGTANHALTMYRHASGARVFGAGTIQWTWGLDATHDRAGTPADARMQQATVNLLADMGVQPASLQGGLVAATASTDAVAPVSAIASPLTNATLQQGVPVTVSGTASDAGGGLVGGVEVSTDNGATWRRATGRANWTYSWSPTSVGTAVLRSRAVDDSGNIESPSAGVSVTVQPRTCPCTIWPASATPTVASADDTGAVNLGVKFTTDQAGTISGIRFYKGAANTGTHVGTLWSSSGQQLASATFTGETATGWQQVNFASPVAVTAGTEYVASYHAPAGGYAADNQYFATTGVDSNPLHALQDGVSGGNGVFVYGASPAFPTSTFQASNYWVDVVFNGPGGANRPPVLTTPTAQTSTRGTPVSLTISASDPDADTLSYGATGLPTGLAINTSTGVISGTPSATGSFTTTVTVQDGRGGSASGSFGWTVQLPANRPPVLTTPAAQTSTRGTPVSLAISASDPDADTLSYGATGLPTGLAIGTSTGVISGTPSATGSFTTTVTVQDGRGGSASGSFGWTVQLPANRPPLLTTPAAQTSVRGTALSLAVSASDPDADPLAFSATGLPTGLAINPGSGVISGTPSAAGTFNPIVTVQDGRGGSASGTFGWTITLPPNRAPTVTRPAPQASLRGTALSFTIAASDPDADPLSYAATGLPTGLSINSTSGIISGTPSAVGTFNTAVTVQDGRGGSASTSFGWAVSEPVANLARGKATLQSTTDFSGSASRAVDGNTDGNFNNGSVTHTASTLQPWWQVDLGQSYNLNNIVLWNRTDCCSDRLQNFYVFISNSNMSGRSYDSLRNDPFVTKRQIGATNISPSLSIAIGSSGRYIRVQLSGTQYLSLAEVQAFASTSTSAGSGLQGQYFATNNLSGNIVLSRTEAVNFNWGNGSPGSGVPSDNFSARWSGKVEASSTGSFQFQTNSDDGIRVWLNGSLIIDNWTSHAPTLNTSASISLTANQRYSITVEYQEFGGGAVAQLSWKPPGSSSFSTVPSSRLYRP